MIKIKGQPASPLPPQNLKKKILICGEKKIKAWDPIIWASSLSEGGLELP